MHYPSSFVGFPNPFFGSAARQIQTLFWLQKMLTTIITGNPIVRLSACDAYVTFSNVGFMWVGWVGTPEECK